jgi:hypothetical protein
VESVSTDRVSGEEVDSRKQARNQADRFAITIACVVAFSVFVVYAEDPFALGRVIVVGIAYLFAIALSIAWLAVSGKPRRAALILLVSTIAVLSCVYASSAWSGYPATNVTSVTSHNCTTTSRINSSGINFISSYSCTENSVPVQNIPVAFGYNLIVWTPLVGCVLYSIPGWGEASPRYYKLARLLGGSVIAAAILLNVVGIGWSGSLQSLPSIHMPLNPYLATGECDSITADTGCVYVSHVYVLADYAFWLSVAILASVAASVFASRRVASGAPIRKGVLLSIALVLVLVMGLIVIPSAIEESGVLVNSGNSFPFYALNSYLRVPFTIGHNETLSGAFDSSAPVDVYVLNSSQYGSFLDNAGWCPVPYLVPLLTNATGGSIGTTVASGSYSLVFCGASALQRNLPSIEVTISSPLRLSSGI